MSTSVYQQGGGGTVGVFPLPIIAQRDPASTDTVSPSGAPYQIMQGWNNELTDDTFIYLGSGNWVEFASITGAITTLTGDSGGAIPPTAGNINILGNDLLTVVGSGSTLTITETEGAYPISPYIVGSSGEAGYTTIQDALDAADAAGGNATVYVQPGTYTEDLILYDTVDLSGSIYSGTTLTGVHTPPTSGRVTIQNFTLTSATDILESAAAGTTEIDLYNCNITVTNGYVFDLANWTGTLSPEGLYDVGSTNNGFINNTGGSSLLIFNCGCGAGTGNTMVTSGSFIAEGSEFFCPVNPQTGSVLQIDECVFDEAVTLSNDTEGTISLSRFSTGASAAITMSSTGAVDISKCVIDSSNSPAIDGAGAGTLTLADVVFLDDSSQAATLTLGTDDVVQASTFRTTPLATQTQLSNQTWSAVGSDANIDLLAAPKGTGSLSCSGDIVLSSVATKISMNGGAVTDFIGTATLTAGTVTIANTNISSSDIVLITRLDPSTSTALGVFEAIITDATQFIINARDPSDATIQTNDVSVVGYVIFRVT